MRKILTNLTFLLALFATVDAVAQTGKIAGRITDATTGESLPGVNVVIEGTTQGTSTRLEGEYVIIGVRPGVYTVVAEPRRGPRPGWRASM